MIKIDLEQLAAVSLLADAEADAQKAILRDLNLELEHTGESLEPHDYAEMHARIEQQEQRVKAASHKACSRRIELDSVRGLEAAKVAREVAERAVDDTLSRLHQTQAAIASKRAALGAIQNELAVLTGKSSHLLQELDRVKSALGKEEVTA